jgi:hypothetical protein
MSYETWFDEECLKLVYRKKQAKLLWLQDPSVVKEDTWCNVRREASRHFRKKEREYLKDKITEIELNSKNKNIRDLYRGITEFEKGYQPKTNLVKDERVDLLANPQKILTRWKNYFCQLLNVQGPGSIRQTEIHTTEPFVTEPSAAELEITIRELKMYTEPGSNQIPAELSQARGEELRYDMHKLIMLVWNKEVFPHQWKESVVVPIHTKGDKTDCSNYRGISLLSTSYKIISNIFLSKLIPYADEIIWDHKCGYRRSRSTTDQIFYIRQIL